MTAATADEHAAENGHNAHTASSLYVHKAWLQYRLPNSANERRAIGRQVQKKQKQKNQNLQAVHPSADTSQARTSTAPWPGASLNLDPFGLHNLSRSQAPKRRISGPSILGFRV